MTESASQTPPGVIPYVDYHTGPKRYVTVGFETSGGPLAASPSRR